MVLSALTPAIPTNRSTRLKVSEHGRASSYQVPRLGVISAKLGHRLLALEQVMQLGAVHGEH